MRLAIDNDFFCKLGRCEALSMFLECMGVSASDSYVLDALPHQLRAPAEGKKAPRLRRAHEAHADGLYTLSQTFRKIDGTNLDPRNLDTFNAIPGIDPGEAILFAFAVENHDVVIATGDKRALRELATIPLANEALKNRIVCVESALRHLSEKHGVPQFREHGKTIGGCDNAIKAAFLSAADDQVLVVLDSYIADLHSITSVDLYFTLK